MRSVKSLLLACYGVFLWLPCLTARVLAGQPDSKPWKHVQIASGLNKASESTASIPIHNLQIGDINRDGLPDVIAGNSLFLNPIDNPGEAWKRIVPDDAIESLFMMTVNGDGNPDLIGVAAGKIFWLEALDPEGVRWMRLPVAELQQSEGWIDQRLYSGLFIPGANDEIFLLADGKAFVIEVPSNPENTPWPIYPIIANDSLSTIQIGDIDNDGLLDIAGLSHTTAGEYTIRWWKNPGDAQSTWTAFPILSSHKPLAELALGDIDGDNRMDLLYSERSGNPNPAANLVLLRQKRRRRIPAWRRPMLVSTTADRIFGAYEDESTSKTGFVAGNDTSISLIKHVRNKRFEQENIYIDRPLNTATVTDVEMDKDSDLIGIDAASSGVLMLWINDKTPGKAR